MFTREGGCPVWVPAFAGTHALVWTALPKSFHPGEGRGPIGKVGMTTDSATLPPSPNWAPAFAGAVP